MNIKSLASVFILIVLIYLPASSQAEFIMKVDGKERLGFFVPSFYGGGVKFEDCGGTRWDIDGGDYYWTRNKCDNESDHAQRSNVNISSNPKPKVCANCSETPDLVDLMETPKPIACATCDESPDTVFFSKFDTQGVEVLDRYLHRYNSMPSLETYKSSKKEMNQFRNIFGPGLYNEEMQFPLPQSTPQNRFNLLNTDINRLSIPRDIYDRSQTVPTDIYDRSTIYNPGNFSMPSH